MYTDCRSSLLGREAEKHLFPSYDIKVFRLLGPTSTTITIIIILPNDYLTTRRNKTYVYW